MFTKEELITKFQKVAAEVTEREFQTLSGDTVISTLGIDSLAMLEIVGAMERDFQVSIPDDQLVGLQTVNDLVSLLQKRLPS